MCTIRQWKMPTSPHCIIFVIVRLSCHALSDSRQAYRPLFVMPFYSSIASSNRQITPKNASVDKRNKTEFPQFYGNSA